MKKLLLAFLVLLSMSSMSFSILASTGADISEGVEEETTDVYEEDEGDTMVGGMQ